MADSIINRSQMDQQQLEDARKQLQETREEVGQTRAHYYERTRKAVMAAEEREREAREEVQRVQAARDEDRKKLGEVMVEKRNLHKQLGEQKEKHHHWKRIAQQRKQLSDSQEVWVHRGPHPSAFDRAYVQDLIRSPSSPPPLSSYPWSATGV